MTRSQVEFEKAQAVFPGGVNSPVRAFKAVGGTPLFIESAKGAYLHDVDNNHYIDYVLSWGPMILGHAEDHVVSAVQQAIAQGTSYGAPSPHETRLGELLQQRVPYLEKLRMVNSGTEATMSAIRVARAYTKRDKIVKFIGCYHGHSDSFLVQAGSGIATLSIPNSPGVTEHVVQDTLTVPYNDVTALQDCFKQYGNQIAAVIVEAVAGNMGFVKGKDSFIQAIRRCTTEHGALMIVDDVMAGFRASYTGSLGVYDVEPDLICLGKVVGGGFPVAVFGGKKEYIDCVAPLGSVYQAGTLSGNPIAMCAGYETLMQLTPDLFTSIEKNVKLLCNGLKELAQKHQIALQVDYAGTMFGFFFSSKKVENFEDAKQANHILFAKVYHLLLERGIYIAPSQYESNFMSSAHTKEDIQATLQAFDDVFAIVKEEDHGTN